MTTGLTSYRRLQKCRSAAVVVQTRVGQVPHSSTLSQAVNSATQADEELSVPMLSMPMLSMPMLARPHLYINSFQQDQTDRTIPARRESCRPSCSVDYQSRPPGLCHHRWGTPPSPTHLVRYYLIVGEVCLLCIGPAYRHMHSLLGVLAMIGLLHRIYDCSKSRGGNRR